MFKRSYGQQRRHGSCPTVDLVAAKSNNLYGGNGNVSYLDGPEKFRRSSKGHMHYGSNDANNGMANNCVYGNPGDLISS